VFRTVAACAALLAILLLSTTPAHAADPMVGKINDMRRAHGVAPLKHAPGLSRASTSYARRLMRADRLAHPSRAAGRFSASGEILALQSGWRVRRAAAVRAWLNSPSHRPILLSRGFRHVGVGMSRGRFGSARSSIWVVRFGRR